MPYQSDDDPVVETLNSMVWGIIGLFAGILAALGIVAWQKYTTAKLPDALEGFSPKSSLGATEKLDTGDLQGNRIKSADRE